MINKYSIDINLTQLFKDTQLKNQFTEKLNNKIILLNKIKENSYKTLSNTTFNINPSKGNEDVIVHYIINITFLQNNALFNVTDSSGTLVFCCSSGMLGRKGKGNRAKRDVFRKFYQVLSTELKFLQGKAVALHLKNVGSQKMWIIELLKKKLFITVIRSLNIHPHNGCRRKKVRRKKLKNKK